MIWKYPQAQQGALKGYINYLATQVPLLQQTQLPIPAQMQVMKFAYPPPTDTASSTALSTPRAQSPESPSSDGVLIESYNPSSHRRDSPPAPAKPASKITTSSHWYLPENVTVLPGLPPRTVPESADSSTLSTAPAPAPVGHWFFSRHAQADMGDSLKDHDKGGSMGLPMPVIALDKLRDMQQIPSPIKPRSPVDKPTTPEVSSPRRLTQPERENGVPHTQLHRTLSPMVSIQVVDAAPKARTVAESLRSASRSSMSSSSRSETPPSLVGRNTPADTIASTPVASPILDVPSASRRNGKSSRVPNYNFVRLQASSRSHSPPIIVHSPSIVPVPIITPPSSQPNILPAANVGASRTGGIPAATVPFPDRACRDPLWVDRDDWDTPQRYMSPHADRIPTSVYPNLQPLHQQIPFTGYTQPAAPISQPIHHQVPFTGYAQPAAPISQPIHYPQQLPPIPQPVYQHTALNNYRLPPGRFQGMYYPKNSTRFFFEDGACLVQVRDVLYQVHKHVLSTSPFLNSELNSWQRVWGPYDLSIFCEPREFELLLSIFYPRDYTQWEAATVEDWTSILQLASEFGMKNICTLAIKQLFPITTGAEKIELANKYDIKDWLMPAYMDLCTRTEELTVDEGNKMGIEAVIGITKMRNQLLANVKNLVERN